MKDNNEDLYTILELDTMASIEQIKKNYKKLALKYHPDKNTNSKIYNEKFNQIRIAYEILSNKEKKTNYDDMITSKKDYFCKIIFSLINKIMNPSIINTIINKPNISKDIKNGKINKLIKKILTEIDSEIDISKLNEIFICTSSYDNIKSDINTNLQENNNDINSSELNTLNIIASIKSNINDALNGRLKEIIVNRKVYDNDNNNIYNETNKYYIPLYENEVIINNAGDKIIDNNNIICGNVILKIHFKNDNNIIKDGYNLIYNDIITLYELFNGFNKKIIIYNFEFNIESNNPFKDFKFDGDNLIIKIDNKGFPYNNNKNGDIFIKLKLFKSDNFNNLIKNF